MVAEFDLYLSESNSNNSNSSFICSFLDSVNVNIYRGFSVVFIVVYSALCFFPIRFFVRYVKQSIAKRKDGKGLLPGMESRLIESGEKGVLASLEGRGRIWSLIFFIFLSFCLVTHAIANICYLLASYGIVLSSKFFHVLLLGDDFALVGTPLGVVSYIIAIAMWWRVFVTLSELRQTNVSSNVSVPNMFKEDKHGCLKKGLIPACFTLSILYVITWAVFTLIMITTQPSEVTCEEYEKVPTVTRYFDYTEMVFFILFAILYFAYAIALIRLYKMRFYDETVRSVVSKVILLCILVGICFVLRVVVFLVMASDDNTIFIVSVFLFFIVADIIPTIITLWLQAKSISTASTTIKVDREMWAPVYPVQD